TQMRGTSRLLECLDDAVANQLVIVLRDEAMDTAFEQETHEWVEDVVALDEMDPGLSIGESLESMFALRTRPQRLADRVVLGRLIRDDVGHVFPRLRDATAEEVLGNPEEAMANQPCTVFVTLVQDLDRHRAVFDLPADRAELSDLDWSTRAV